MQLLYTATPEALSQAEQDAALESLLDRLISFFVRDFGAYWCVKRLGTQPSLSTFPAPTGDPALLCLIFLFPLFLRGHNDLPVGIRDYQTI